MAMHHDSAALGLDHRSETGGTRNDRGNDSTAGLAVAALLLALLLGFSATDRQAPAAGPGMSEVDGETVLDGRGKWGGYLP